MMKITYTEACILLQAMLSRENAYHKGRGACLEVIHNLCKNASRRASATVGFAAGVIYGVRRERERRQQQRR